MELIDTAEPTARAGVDDMSPREAFAALLIGAARADGSVSPHEANRIEHVVAAMKLFRGCSQETLQSMFTTAAERINEHGSDIVVRAAAAAIPTKLRATAYAMAIDLLLADGRTRHREQRFANDLQTLLGVDDNTVAKVVEVLTLKNAG